MGEGPLNSDIEEIESFVRRTRAQRAAEEDDSTHVVCLVAFPNRIQWQPGSNVSYWPGYIKITTECEDPRRAVKREVLEDPIEPREVVRAVYVATERHAARLKERLDALFYGDSEEAQLCRGKFINFPQEPWHCWDVILPLAIEQVNQREHVDVFDKAEWRRRVAARKRRGR